ncbi:DUF2309 domain-containing protein [Acidithiobacillus concretivorus]|uniref:Probable inorganic carbon transporter subunit DabA n=1 Tax=Acidithiobacillus concretivorus TaxID=3063952 RepID=A0ABS5ZQJ3_9PROT|nr:DUF2309 domain-containing protein [Acidithiobacillus concretivorus]MBU2738735.1 DUF2309 domain-containing protein [Acidithiobacillus concretivorus]
MDHQLTLGDRLKVRTMIYVASEPIPRFWPMRTFIHHNPLFGLEHLPFEEAVDEAGRLFHGRGYLSRSEYQEYWQDGKVDEVALRKYLHGFLEKHAETLPGISMEHWLWSLLTRCQNEQMVPKTDWLDGRILHAVLHGKTPEGDNETQKHRLQDILSHKIALDGPVYANVDRLFGTDIGSTLDDLLVKSCLDFFDEGQSAWQSPGRKQGFFAAWKEVAQHNVRFFLRGLHLRNLLESEVTPEGVVAHILRDLKVPEESWQKYITRQLTRLHGWAGFIRYRSTAKHYYWAEQYPADLTDFLAVRMVLGMALLQEAVRHHACPANAEEIQDFVHADPFSAYLRLELYTGSILPAWAQPVEDLLARRKRSGFEKMAQQYITAKSRWEAERQVKNLQRLAKVMGAEAEAELLAMTPDQLDRFLEIIRAWEKQEGFTWLRSMESHYIKDLVNRIHIPQAPAAAEEKRPFAQALLCIDVRSEPMRRHLEAIGDYQTFGIGGFFGVPISFLEYGRGTEVHLCPAIQTPKNLVLEIPAELELEEEPLYGALEHVLHELKSSVLSPFVAVEAVGLIFSLGLIGKTVAPLTYHHLHHKLHAEKPVTRLLLDKLSPDQADSILRAVQRAMIVRALIKEWNVPRDQVTDDDVKELREIALEHISGPSALAQRRNFSAQQESEFIQKLRDIYRVERHETSLQMERLGRIGFSLDEQVRYISQALLLIGMNRNFSRFVLLVGHESTTENNPYESALDCGACGGGKGLPNARVFAAMANKPEVRRRLRDKGIIIPDDTWFMPAVHNTTSDVVDLYDVDMLPARHLLYLERLRNGLSAATRRSAAERMPQLGGDAKLAEDPYAAAAMAQRLTHDWSQVRPEWGLTRNAYAIVGRRELTEGLNLESRAFLHSYDYRLDPKGRLLETILSSPMVVGEWINLEHYFSVVDTEHYGSGSKVYHNVAGRFAVMTGNQSDLRTGLPTQTVLKDGKPYHEPVRLIVLVEAPLAFAQRSVGNLVKIKALLGGGWVRVIIMDPEDDYHAYVLEDGAFHLQERTETPDRQTLLEEIA